MDPTAIPANIFTLPLELRQQIYDELLPKDRVLEIGRQESEHRQNLETICKAHLQIDHELRSWVAKRCGYRFIFTPDMELPSSDLPYDRMKEIQIRLNLYDRDNAADELMALRRKLAAFVSILGRYDTLPLLTVQWQNPEIVEQDYWNGNVSSLYCWADGIGYAGLRKGVYDYTLVEYILTPLMSLPRCDGAIVDWPMNQMDEEDCWEGGWDVDYVKAWCDGLESWLEGERGRALSDMVAGIVEQGAKVYMC